MSIGGRLKEERLRLGLSQTAFGLLRGAGKTTVIAWERGTAFPNAQFLEQAALIGADVRYIVTGLRDGPPPLKPEEQLVLERYRSAPRELRDAALRVLLGGGDMKTSSGTKASARDITIHGGISGQAALGKIVNKGERKK